MSGPSQTRRRALVIGAAALVLVGAARPVRRIVLQGAADLLVVEDDVAAVDLVALSGASIRAGAFEAAEWVRARRAQTVLVPNWPLTPIDRMTRDLGVSSPSVMDLAHDILVRRGVPEASILIADQPADGTGLEVMALAAVVARRGVRSVLFLTDPTHTARARWLLRRRLPAGVAVGVRSPRWTRLGTPWWHDRAAARDVALEYLRWANELVLGDPWRRWPAHAVADEMPS